MHLEGGERERQRPSREHLLPGMSFPRREELLKKTSSSSTFYLYKHRGVLSRQHVFDLPCCSSPIVSCPGSIISQRQVNWPRRPIVLRKRSARSYLINPDPASFHSSLPLLLSLGQDRMSQLAESTMAFNRRREKRFLEEESVESFDFSFESAHFG